MKTVMFLMILILLCPIPATPQVSCLPAYFAWQNECDQGCGANAGNNSSCPSLSGVGLFKTTYPRLDYPDGYRSLFTVTGSGQCEAVQTCNPILGVGPPDHTQY